VVVIGNVNTIWVTGKQSWSSNGLHSIYLSPRWYSYCLYVRTSWLFTCHPDGIHIAYMLGLHDCLPVTRKYNIVYCPYKKKTDWTG